RGQYNVSVWEGVEALFAVQGDNIYVRYRNGNDPNGMTIRVGPFSDIRNNGSPEFAPFLIRSRNYVSISDFEIRGSPSGVVVAGTAQNTIIENNMIKAADA